MGSWIGYHLTIGTGTRDPRAVRADLRSELARVVPDLVPKRRAVVSIEGETVHWGTGEEHRNPVYKQACEEPFVPKLDVPARWALGVREQEAEYNGGGTLYAWVDGQYVEIEDFCGRFGGNAGDALAHYKREWNIDGSKVTRW